MTAFTLAGWKLTTAGAVVNTLPLQTTDEALILVDEYLSTIGGWVPNDPGDTTGEGFPANGLSPSEAASEITSARLERTHRLDGKMNIEVNLQYIANFVPGQDDEDIIAQMRPLIEDFVQQQLSNSPLGFIDITEVTGSVTAGGQETSEERVKIREALDEGRDQRDPRVVALRAALRLYNLDDTWNVQTTYTEPNLPLVVVIRKYLNTAYISLDTGSQIQYVMTVNPNTFSVSGGVSNPVT